jgi:hypothetical protein
MRYTTVSGSALADDRTVRVFVLVVDLSLSHDRDFPVTRRTLTRHDRHCVRNESIKQSQSRSRHQNQIAVAALAARYGGFFAILYRHKTNNHDVASFLFALSFL